MNFKVILTLMLHDFALIANCQVTQDYYIPLQTVSDCLSGNEDLFHQMYDMSRLACRNCAQNSTFQTITEDGLACECRDSYKLIQNTGAADIYCEACPTNYVTSSNRWTCVVCDTGDITTECTDCTGQLELTAEKYLDGSNLTNNEGNSTRTCVTCSDGASPSHPGSDSRCVRCDDILRVQDGSCDCSTDKFVGGVCFNSSSDLEPDYPELYTVTYGADSTLTSLYLQDNLRAAHGMCSSGPNVYGNLTACQLLANMCVLLMYTGVNGPPTQDTCGFQNPCNDACSLHRRFYTQDDDSILEIQPPGEHNIIEWTANMPWLFYGDNTDNINLRYTTISTSYTAYHVLNVTAEVYSLDGNCNGTLEVADTSRLVISLCPFLQGELSEILRFGKKYTKTCDIRIDSLFDESTYETVFYDLNIPYVDSSGTGTGVSVYMYAVPLLVTNYQNINRQYPNAESSENAWQLTRRLFLVDRVSGVETSGARPSILQYLKSSKLHVNLQDDNNEGKIYPPYMELEYDTVTANQYGTGAKVQITFEVQYGMSLSSHNQHMSISSGVMAALAIVYAAYLAGNWNRRQGKIAIDCTTLVVFFTFSCGTLASAFFLVNLGFSFWWLLLCKMEDTIVMVPDEDGETFLRAFIGSTFALQFLAVVQMFVEQCTVDIFFLDWERPRSSMKTLSEEERRIRRPTQNDGKVSVWRRLFVANEWNELQTIRRPNVMLLLILTLFFLEVVGMKNLARFDTSGSFSDTGEIRGDFSNIFRFSVGCLVYITVGLVLWILHSLVWNRFINNPIQNFVDLCSLCNVSIIIMTHDQFGYYIHGRTVHGFGDLSLKQMYECLKKEEHNLCSERGLDQSYQQTFEILLPNRLRIEYDRALKPYLLRNFQRRGLTTRLDVDIEEKIKTYDILNRFFQSFIDHNLNHVDYMIVDRTLKERLLQTEIQSYREIGYFYTDNGGNVFTKAIFFGNEIALHLLLLSFFSLVDLLATDYVLAGVLTFLLNMILTKIRESLGKRNLEQKTLVDGKFLI